MCDTLNRLHHEGSIRADQKEVKQSVMQVSEERIVLLQEIVMQGSHEGCPWCSRTAKETSIARVEGRKKRGGNEKTEGGRGSR